MTPWEILDMPFIEIIIETPRRAGHHEGLDYPLPVSAVLIPPLLQGMRPLTDAFRIRIWAGIA
jgi:hypothetical protein